MILCKKRLQATIFCYLQPEMCDLLYLFPFDGFVILMNNLGVF